MEDFCRKLVEELAGLEATVLKVDYQKRGYHLEIFMDPSQIRDVANILLTHEFFLDFVTAADVADGLTLIYQFAHFERTCRVNAKAQAPKGEAVPTISDIFHGANWHERETRDFFGVIFADHPDMTPLLLAEEDVDLKPLLKDAKSIKDSETLKLTRPAAPTPGETAEPQGKKVKAAPKDTGAGDARKIKSAKEKAGGKDAS